MPLFSNVSMNMIACSATALAFAAFVVATGIPISFAAEMSTSSYPAPGI